MARFPANIDLSSLYGASGFKLGGNDTLTGGTGRDLFVFDAPLDPATNVDQITDFDVAADTIRLSQAIFTQLAAGVPPADAFHIGSSAHDASGRIYCDSVTGALSYDSDGTGGAAATQYATLSPRPRPRQHGVLHCIGTR